MNHTNSPKHIKNIIINIKEKLDCVKKHSTETLQNRQSFIDDILKIYREAFSSLIENTKTYSNILNDIKASYENAIQIRDERITFFISQDRIFGISEKKSKLEENMLRVMKENEDLKEQILKLNLELTKLKEDMEKAKDENFSEYLNLGRERDARYTLYFENLALHSKLRELDGSAGAAGAAGGAGGGDPVVLRIALDRCREQLSATQAQLVRTRDEYAETVPRREHDVTEARLYDVTKHRDSVRAEYEALHDKLKRVSAEKKSLEEELGEAKDKLRELERAATPRPRWEVAADFIGGGRDGGGRDRWRQLARGLSSRELCPPAPPAPPAPLEHFEGLGLDPALPPYLRYSGRVRNLRLSRREVSVLITDVWAGKAARRLQPMQQFVTAYFEDRYGQPSVRAEWAYNLCAAAEQMLDEPQVRLFWGVLHGRLSEDIYWGLRAAWAGLRAALARQARQTVTIEEFEKTAKALFPLKSEVDIRALADTARRQLKLKVNQTELQLDKLFQESSEGFDRSDLARELFRQRQAAQERYLREVLAELRGRGGRGARGGRGGRAGRGGARGGGRGADAPVTPEDLKRAIAIVDPAIDHIRMERHLRWVFGAPPAGPPAGPPAAPALPLRAVAQRLAQGDVQRAGPRGRPRRLD